MTDIYKLVHDYIKDTDESKRYVYVDIYNLINTYFDGHLEKEQ